MFNWQPITLKIFYFSPNNPTRQNKNLSQDMWANIDSMPHLSELWLVEPPITWPQSVFLLVDLFEWSSEGQIQMMIWVLMLLVCEECDIVAPIFISSQFISDF